MSRAGPSWSARSDVGSIVPQASLHSVAAASARSAYRAPRWLRWQREGYCRPTDSLSAAVPVGPSGPTSPKCCMPTSSSAIGRMQAPTTRAAESRPIANSSPSVCETPIGARRCNAEAERRDRIDVDPTPCVCLMRRRSEASRPARVAWRGGVAERSMAADCKSADSRLRRFESFPLHHRHSTTPAGPRDRRWFAGVAQW